LHCATTQLLSKLGSINGEVMLNSADVRWQRFYTLPPALGAFSPAVEASGGPLCMQNEAH
jgi:hypothetical protein